MRIEFGCLGSCLDPIKHVIFDPLGIPPLGRVYRHPVEEKAKVKMVAPRQAGRTAAANHILLFDLLAGLHNDRTQVAVKGDQPATMIDQYRVPVDAKVVGVKNDPIV
jgi:hypothetical protein